MNLIDLNKLLEEKYVLNEGRPSTTPKLYDYCIENNLPNILWAFEHGGNSASPKDINIGGGKKYNWLCTNCKENIIYRNCEHVLRNNQDYVRCHDCITRRGTSTTPTLYDYCIENNLDKVLWSYNNGGNEKTASDVHIGDNVNYFNWMCTDCERNIRSATIANVINDNNKHKLDDANNVRCLSCSRKFVKNNRIQKFIDDGGSLQSRFPEVATEWDWEANKNLVNDKGEALTPLNISSNYGGEINWICSECGTHYKATIRNRVRIQHGATTVSVTCPKCKMRYGTSRAENTVYYYVHKIIPETNHNIRTLPHISELDVYVNPNNMYRSGLGIEYNGEYYHKDRVKQDETKLQGCKKNNIPLIIIEGLKDKNTVYSGLHTYDTGDYTYYKCEYYYTNNDDLVKIIKDIGSKFLNTDIDVDLDRDGAEINEIKNDKIKENNIGILFPHIALDWSYLDNKCSPLSFTQYAEKGNKWKPVWKCHICGATFNRKIDVITQDGDKSGCYYHSLNGTNPIKIEFINEEKIFDNSIAAAEYINKKYNLSREPRDIITICNHLGVYGKPQAIPVKDKVTNKLVDKLRFKYNDKSKQEYNSKRHMHKLWRDDDEKECLAAQTKLFNNEISVDEFEAFLKEKRNQVMDRYNNDSTNESLNEELYKIEINDIKKLSDNLYNQFLTLVSTRYIDEEYIHLKGLPNFTVLNYEFKKYPELAERLSEEINDIATQSGDVLFDELCNNVFAVNFSKLLRKVSAICYNYADDFLNGRID